MQYFYFRHAKKAISESTNSKQAAVYRKQNKQHLVTTAHHIFNLILTKNPSDREH